jgi:polar amino acid transport system substrate-binding protein
MKSLHFSLFLFLVFALVTTSPAQPVKESVYDRVMRTGVIKVTYAMNPPIVMKDPNTGKLSGIMYEAINKAFENIGIKVEWTDEVGWGVFPEVLNSDRCDIEGAAAWLNAPRAKACDFSNPICFSVLGVWVRADDHRFDKDPSLLNDPGVTLGVLDGEMSSVIAQTEFPKAKLCTLPQLADISQSLLNVETKKADACFVELAIAADYLKHNPGKLRNIAADRPFRVFGNAVMFKHNEPAFKSLVNNLFADLQQTGFIDKLIKKYEPYPGAYYRVAPSYSLK